MFRRRQRHSVPGLNTTSTADISFMLLIFFLVTTSMDSDKGLGRQLPPYEPDKQEQVRDINKEDVLTITLTADNKVLIGDCPTPSDMETRRALRHFIIEHGKQHILELHIHRDASYETYFHLQNQIVLAYREIRNAAAEKKFGRKMNECYEEDRETIMKMYPQRIMETEER